MFICLYVLRTYKPLVYMGYHHFNITKMVSKVTNLVSNITEVVLNITNLVTLL